jgi:hypothetical protein
LILGIITAIVGSLLGAVTGSAGFGAGLGFLAIIVFPIMYGAIGFVAGAIGALIYNLVARWVGGIEIEFQQ